MDQAFTNRTVIVTGAAGNLGAAVTAEFAQRGANLVAMDLGADALAKAYGTWPQTLTVPVNLLEHDGAQYLVSARGHGEWVRNVRANGGRLDLLLGKRRRSYVATEVGDADKVDVLRAYLRKWKAEVGVFFDGVDATSTDEAILAIAADHPVFALEAA